MNWLHQLLPIMAFLITGLGVLLATRAPLRRLPLAGTIGLAFWTGALVITFVITLAAVITGKILLFLVWPLYLAAGAMIVMRWRDLIPEGGWRLTKSEKIQLAFSIPILLLILYNVGRATYHNLQFEIISYDAVGNFAMKAKLWYFSRELFPPQLLDGEYIMFKRRYPPMVIMSETVWAYLMGEWNGVGIKFYFLAVWICAGLFIYALVRQRGNIVTGCLAAAVFYAIPINVGYIWIGALTGYGDVPLGVAFLAASLALGLWVETDKGRAQWGAALVAALMLSSAFWTKKEGIPFVAAAMLYLVVRRRPLKQLAMAAGVCAGFFVVYVLSVRNLPSHFEKDITLDLPWIDLEYRLNRFWHLFEEQIYKKNKWGERLWGVMTFVWIFKLFALRWRYWVTRELYFLAAMMALYTVVLVMTFFGFERNFDFLFERLFLQVYPLIVVATFAGFSPATPWPEIPPTQDTV